MTPGGEASGAALREPHPVSSQATVAHNLAGGFVSARQVDWVTSQPPRGRPLSAEIVQDLGAAVLPVRSAHFRDAVGGAESNVFGVVHRLV